MQNTTERKDVYSRITAQIVEHLEKLTPWAPVHSEEMCAETVQIPTPNRTQKHLIVGSH